MKAINNHYGFTLVEIILYIGILTMFLTILTGIFTSVVNVQLASQSTSSTHTDGQYILARVSFDVGRAQAIVIPINPADEGTMLELTIEGQPYTYTLVDNNLTLTTPSATTVLNSYDTTINSVNFLRIGNPGGKHAVQVGFTLTSVTVPFQGAELRSFQTTVGTR